MSVAGIQTAAATSSASTSQGTSASKGNTQLDMNSFLTMFTTQLQHQDPSNPLQSYELAAQLAQFSTVSVLTNIDKTLQTQQSYLASINNAQMIGTIGKEVVGMYDGVQLKDGQISKASYKLAEAADQVTVKITDSEGNLVRTMELGPQQAGQVDLAWDGLNDKGEAVPNGEYHFDVEAVAGEEKTPVEVLKTVSGTATSFRMEQGQPYLILGGADGLKLPIGNVMQVSEPTA